MASIPGAIIGAAGSILGGFIGSGSAKGAGKTLANAGNQASTNLQNVVQTQQGFVSGAGTAGQAGVDAGKNQSNAVLSGVNSQEQTNLNPYLQSGTAGINAFASANAPGGSLTTQFAAPTAAQAQATPGYQFQLDQGNQAIARSAAASGSLGSGGTAKALDQYSQGLASTYYQNAYNNALQSFQTNRNNTFQDLTTQAGMGMQAVGMSNSANQNYGNLTSANTMNSASQVANIGDQTAQYNAGYGLQGTIASTNDYINGQSGYAAGQVGAGNSWSNALNGVAGAAGNFAAGGGFGGGYGVGGFGGGGYGPSSSGGANPYGVPTTAPDGSLVYNTSGGGSPAAPNTGGGPSLYPQSYSPQLSPGVTPGAPAGGGNPFFVPNFVNNGYMQNPNQNGVPGLY